MPIYIYRKGKRFGMRHWDCVPRVGEIIELRVEGVWTDHKVTEVRYRGDTVPNVSLCVK